MTRRKTVAANWKMNTLLPEAMNLAGEILEKTKSRSDVEKIIFPPFPFVKEVAGMFSDQSGFAVGAQNCSQHEKGAFTGEVSAPMLKSVGAAYVIIGHSERRQQFREEGSELYSKVQQALKAGLKVIYCIGENLNERKNELQYKRVEEQLLELFGKLNKEEADQIILAYEPVWAIGTGETATPAQAQDMHAFIRSRVAQWLGTVKTEKMIVLYGGSCNAKNARDLFACADVDGGLIGGASLNAEEFSVIVNSF